MASNPLTHVTATLRRDDLAKLREHWPEPIPIHRVVHELLLGYRQPNGASLGAPDHSPQPTERSGAEPAPFSGPVITPLDLLARDHLGACPLRAFPPDDLQKYRLTLDYSVVVPPKL